MYDDDIEMIRKKKSKKKRDEQGDGIKRMEFDRKQNIKI